MEKRTVTINGHELPLYHCHTLVIGSGAAALELRLSPGAVRVKDVLIVTAKLGAAPARQARISRPITSSPLRGGEGPVYEMARTPLCGRAILGTRP